jgi:hypothetical protein
MTNILLSENELVIVGHDDWRSIWSCSVVLVPHDVFPMTFWDLNWDPPMGPGGM